METKLIMFDLDGTLIDSAPDIHGAIDRMLADAGQPSLPFETLRPMIGDGARSLVERVLAARPNAGLTVEQALEAYLDQYARDPVRLTRPYPMVPEILADLTRTGVPLTVSTNKPEGLSRTVLEALGLAPFVVDLVGGDSFAFRKPDPRMLTVLLERYRVAPDAAILVGDSEIDAATAVAAGVPLILVRWGYHRGSPEAIPALARIDRFEELPDLIP